MKKRVADDVQTGGRRAGRVEIHSAPLLCSRLQSDVATLCRYHRLLQLHDRNIRMPLVPLVNRETCSGNLRPARFVTVSVSVLESMAAACSECSCSLPNVHLLVCLFSWWHLQRVRQCERLFGGRVMCIARGLHSHRRRISRLSASSGKGGHKHTAYTRAIMAGQTGQRANESPATV